MLLKVSFYFNFLTNSRTDPNYLSSKAMGSWCIGLSVCLFPSKTSFSDELKLRETIFTQIYLICCLDMNHLQIISAYNRNIVLLYINQSFLYTRYLYIYQNFPWSDIVSIWHYFSFYSIFFLLVKHKEGGGASLALGIKFATCLWS